MKFIKFNLEIKAWYLFAIPFKVIRQGPCAHPKVSCSLEGMINANETFSDNQYRRQSNCQGKCPGGVSGDNCHKCMHGYRGYTSFGCKGKMVMLLID